MELTGRTKPVANKVKPVLFDQFQKSADWMVPRGRFYYTPMGAFAKGMTGGDIFVCLFINCLSFGTLNFKKCAFLKNYKVVKFAKGMTNLQEV